MFLFSEILWENNSQRTDNVRRMIKITILNQFEFIAGENLCCDDVNEFNILVEAQIFPSCFG